MKRNLITMCEKKLDDLDINEDTEKQLNYIFFPKVEFLLCSKI